MEFDRIEEAVNLLEKVVGALEPELVVRDPASYLLDLFVRGGRRGPDQHNACGESEDRGGSPEHSRIAGEKSRRDDKAREPRDKKNRRQPARAGAVFQRASEYEKKEHIAEKVQDIAVHEKPGEQRPYPAVFQIRKTKNQMLLGDGRVHLPGAEAGPDAGEYQ